MGKLSLPLIAECPLDSSCWGLFIRDMYFVFHIYLIWLTILYCWEFVRKWNPVAVIYCTNI